MNQYSANASNDPAPVDGAAADAASPAAVAHEEDAPAAGVRPADAGQIPLPEQLRSANRLLG